MTTKTAIATKATFPPKIAPPKKGGSLLFPSDPLAAMRELSNLDSVREAAAGALPSPEEYTEKNTYLNAEIHAHKDAETIAELYAGMEPETLISPHTELDAEAPSPRRVQKRKAMMPEGKPEIHTASHTIDHTTEHTPKHGSGHTSVRQRIIEDMAKEPVVRKTIDIPASLNNRLQDYCAAKRIKTERRVFLVLLENFLEEEGF